MEKTYFTIRDLSHGRYLRCGESYDGQLYHGEKSDTGSSEWTAVKVADSERYYIISKLHEKYLVAGQVADNHAYHQQNSGNPTAQWSIEPAPAPLPGIRGWKITDGKHLKSLVAGQVYDGHVYHQDMISGSMNLAGIWVLEYASGPADNLPDFVTAESASYNIAGMDLENIIGEAGSVVGRQ